MNMKKTLALILAITTAHVVAQPASDSAMIRSIYDHALTRSKCYENLEYLSNTIGPRLSGSAQAERAVIYSKKLMEEYGFDRVFLQEVMVPHWVRGAKEEAYFISANKKETVQICALGGSVATPAKGIKAPVIEVKSQEELEKLGKEAVAGKIVFFNRPMDPRHIETFNAYSTAVDQRSRGAIWAAKMGAVGVIVRSMTLSIHRAPHTGSMRYEDGVTKIPAAAISTYDADLLSAQLKKRTVTEFWFKQSCQTLPDVLSYNVIGEIKGSEFPDEIIVVGGHLDSWDLGTGAHDDGAGCVQSVEVLRTFKELGIKPKHTLRAVLFMNEENGVKGGLKYAELAKENGEKHLAAIETDAGGFTPRGFSIEAEQKVVSKIRGWRSLLEPYGLGDIRAGWSGVDISPLKPQGPALIGFMPDSQRYFDVHHAATDTFDAVNKRELELGAASMAALVYLIDTYGL